MAVLSFARQRPGNIIENLDILVLPVIVRRAVMAQRRRVRVGWLTVAILSVVFAALAAFLALEDGAHHHEEHRHEEHRQQGRR